MGRERSEEKVKLVTRERELQDAMLAEYPHPLSPDKQYRVEKLERGKIFHFNELNYSELLRFLKDYRRYEFEIRNEKDELIEENKLRKFKVSNN